MEGYTPIPKLQVKDLGTEGTGDRLALFDSDGKFVGFVLKSSIFGNFLPLSGGEMTGDLVINDSYLDFYFEGNKYISINGEEGIYFWAGGEMGIQPNKIVGSDYTLYFSGKGIVGHEFHNKQNDPKSFAQLGDLKKATSVTITEDTLFSPDDFGNKGMLTVFVDTTAGDVTINLSAASITTGLVLKVIKKTADVNKVIIDGSATETINGQPTQEILLQYGKLTIESDGVTNYLM